MIVDKTGTDRVLSCVSLHYSDKTPSTRSRSRSLNTTLSAVLPPTSVLKNVYCIRELKFLRRCKDIGCMKDVLQVPLKVRRREVHYVLRGATIFDTGYVLTQ